MKVLSVVIPVYNEANTVLTVLDSVLSVKLGSETKIEAIVVDDCSSDDSIELVDNFMRKHQKRHIILVKQDKNKGKGAALRTGIQHATGDYIIIQDADLEYDPNEFNLLLKPMLDGRADVVYGSRFMGGKPHRILFFWHSIGNKFLTMMSNVATNLNLTDMETCYKLFKADIIKNIDLKENRFGFEPEVTAKIARIPGIRIYEVGISYYGRTYAEGKKINWKDGFRALYCIAKYGFLRM
ncbi:MAG: glycosyltransferase family 2 protein [Cyclobacteriaceae bacterium]